MRISEIDGARRVATPILVVYAMVGRWTFLDLQKDRSFLRTLAEAGCEVYVMDWSHRTPADRFDDFGDLIDRYIDGFVDAISDRHGIDRINLLGICQGGVLSLCYAALSAPRRDRTPWPSEPLNRRARDWRLRPPGVRARRQRRGASRGAGLSRCSDGPARRANARDGLPERVS